MLEADVLVGGRVDLSGHDEVLAQCDGVQMFFGGPPAQPHGPRLFEDEVLDEFAVVAGDVVFGDEQNLARVGHGFRQRHLRRIPVASAQEGEVLALLEWHEVVGEP